MISSVGTLYGAQDMLRDLQAMRITRSGFLASFPRYGTSTAEDVLELAIAANWVAVAKAGQILATAEGQRLVSEEGRGHALRLQLESVIRYMRPPWAGVLARGRTETANLLPDALRQCFDEAGLLEGEDDGSVRWWDRLSRWLREDKEARQVEVGRWGERRTVAYETARTKVRPDWVALDTDFAGYDVLSRAGPRDASRLRIEVKASTQPIQSALLHVTVNEWSVAETLPDHYLFHLWLLGPKEDVLIQVSTALLARHVPRNRGRGEWECVEIPFVAFEDLPRFVSPAQKSSTTAD